MDTMPDPYHRWYVINVNPEPWAIGTVSHNRISPNPLLVTYQKAVREELEGEAMLPKEMRKLTFYFFRKIEKYLDAADHVRTRNAADATNLQKGLEDALQGILFENDREVRDIRSVIAQQGYEVDPPFIIIHAERTYYAPVGADEIPPELLEQAFRGYGGKKGDKTARWRDADTIF
jgi:Endodeoxyribonuclease RusA